MRKVIYTIDDVEAMRRKYRKEMAADELENILSDLQPFRCIFTLFSQTNSNKCVDRYSLTDWNGNKININSLNGYQRGIVLSQCYQRFEGRLTGESSGVIKIEEQEETGK